jgi:glucose/arabinose dehydrogenase
MTCVMRVRCISGCSTGFGRALATLVLVAGLVSGAPMLVQAQAPRSPTPAPVNGAVRVQTVARGLEHPWALAFLPAGRMLVTERPGRVRIVEPDGRLSEPLAGVPRVQARGPRFGRMGIVTSRAPRSIRKPASCGPWSTERAAVTSSTGRRLVRTTAGPSSPMASTTRGRELAKAQRSQAWSSRSTTGIR